jgi:hypothetical protein
VHFDAERFACCLVDGEVEIEAAPAYGDVEFGVVGEQLPLDDIARLVAVEGDHLVARLQTGPLCRRSGRDGHDAREGHGVKDTAELLLA